MHPFVEYRLSKEPQPLRRLIWILEMKRSIPRWNSRNACRTRRWFNIKRDKQVKFLEEKGLALENIFGFVRKYGFSFEMCED